MSVAGNLGRQSFPVPIGSIFLFAGVSRPDTYLVCDGTAYNTAEYPLLQTALGGSDVLPDLRQKIIGGGPVVDVGVLVPAVSSPIVADDLTLTSANIPTIDFDLTIETASQSVVSTDVSGPNSALQLAKVLIGTGPIIASSGSVIVNPSPETPATSITATVPNPVWSPSAFAPVQPTIDLAGSLNEPARVVFRYIIKAKY